MQTSQESNLRPSHYQRGINSVEFFMLWGISLSSFKSAVCRMGWKANAYNAWMWLLGYRAEIAQMVERPSGNGKVSGSIPGSVAFSHCWFKNYSVFYSSVSVIIMAEEMFCLNFQGVDLSNFVYLCSLFRSCYASHIV